VLPRLTYPVDRTLPGWAGPGEGWRWAAQVSGTPGPSVNFLTALADARRYVPVGREGPWPVATLALRASGGISIGPDPQRFYAAGVTSWLNPTYRSLPVQSADDFVFAVPVLPLRGFGYNEAAGDRFAALNLEVRAPIAASLFPGALPALVLGGLQAVVFADAAVIASGDVDVWREVDDGAGGTRRELDDVLLGAGVGLRTIVLGYPVRADWAWPFEGERFGETRFYVSVGADF
jgi:outer membrane protein assembly factor BamA